MLFSKVNYRLFFNQYCVLCRLHPAQINGVCEGCHQDLPWLLFPCPRCGQTRRTPNAPCHSCDQQHYAFDFALAAFEYRFPLNAILPLIKQRHSLHHLGWLSRLLAEKIKDNELTLPDSILPVPMHLLDELRRGYNQAAILSEQLGKHLSLPVQYDALIKSKRTPHQHNLKATQRRANLQGAFQLKRSLPSHIALVDDVMTTGSTLNELARLLKKQGVSRVDIWVLARTPEPDID